MKNFFALLCSVLFTFTLTAADMALPTIPQTTDGGYELGARNALNLYGANLGITNLNSKIQLLYNASTNSDTNINLSSIAISNILRHLTIPPLASQVVNVVTNTSTNLWVTSTNVYHTFMLKTYGTTTNLSVLLERGTSSTNMVPFSTNVFTADTVVEVQATGAWWWMRASVFFAADTNGAVAIDYFGRP